MQTSVFIVEIMVEATYSNPFISQVRKQDTERLSVPYAKSGTWLVVARTRRRSPDSLFNKPSIVPVWPQICLCGLK